MPNFTTDDLLRYLYNELAPLEKEALKHAAIRLGIAGKIAGTSIIYATAAIFTPNATQAQNG